MVKRESSPNNTEHQKVRNNREKILYKAAEHYKTFLFFPIACQKQEL